MANFYLLLVLWSLLEMLVFVDSVGRRRVGLTFIYCWFCGVNWRCWCLWVLLEGGG